MLRVGVGFDVNGAQSMRHTAGVDPRFIPEVRPLATARTKKKRNHQKPNGHISLKTPVKVWVPIVTVVHSQFRLGHLCQAPARVILHQLCACVGSGHTEMVCKGMYVLCLIY
jgi:hypothetical protein